MHVFCSQYSTNRGLPQADALIFFKARLTGISLSPLRQAEKLEVEDDANKENEVFGSSGNMGRYGLSGTKDIAALTESDDSLSINVGDTRAVIIMDAHCIIQIANKGA